MFYLVIVGGFNFFSVWLPIGYYHGAPAIVMDLIRSKDLTNHDERRIHMNFKKKFEESNEFWFLGKSYFRINISPKNEKQCGNLSCYEKSLQTNKICIPGIFKIYYANESWEIKF